MTELWSHLVLSTAALVGGLHAYQQWLDWQKTIVVKRLKEREETLKDIKQISRDQFHELNQRFAKDVAQARLLYKCGEHKSADEWLQQLQDRWYPLEP